MEQPALDTEQIYAFGLDSNQRKFAPNKMWRVIPPGPQEIGILGNFYDVKRFVKHHPGGDVILEYCGKDATVPFLQFHEEHVLKYVKKTNKTYDLNLPKADREWIKLNEKFHQLGYFGKSKIYFMVRLLFVMFLAMIVFFGVRFDLIWIPAIAWGMVWRQAGFLTHFLEHNQLFQSRHVNQLWGSILASGVAGLNGTWWKFEHNEHHLFTCSYVENHGLADPSFNEDSWVENDVAFGFKMRHLITRLLLPVQHFVYFFGCLLWGRGAIMLSCWSNFEMLYPMEVAGFLCHISYITGIYLMVGSLSGFLQLYFIASFVQGFLALQLTISHLTMPYVSKEFVKSSSTLERQAAVTIDVRTSQIWDWAWGGLSLHLVHHLFPRMHPMFAREATEEIKLSLKQLDVTYHEMSPSEAVWFTVTHLYEKSKKYQERKWIAKIAEELSQIG